MNIRERIAKQKKEAVQRKKEAANQLTSANAGAQEEMINETLFYYQVFGLKFRIQDSLKENTYRPEHSFGSFMNMYLELLQSNTKELATNISIDERFLNKLINGQNWLPGNIAVRLELHSNNIIPATFWFKLAAKQRLYIIENNSKLREKQKIFVHVKL
jgi:plasmid maintenance system antidote protein VapI